MANLDENIIRTARQLSLLLAKAKWKMKNNGLQAAQRRRNAKSIFGSVCGCSCIQKRLPTFHPLQDVNANTNAKRVKVLA